MAIAVLMPELGESVDEATITQWLKAVGDEVAEYEPLLEVNTDKVDTEIPSPAGGVVLRILAVPDQTVRAGTTLAWIGAPGESVPDDGSAPAHAPVEKAATAAVPVVKAKSPAAGPLLLSAPAPGASPAGRTQRPGRDPDLGFISPVVARMASENDLDLRQITGTGLEGRITKLDVQAFLDTRAAAPVPQAAAPVTALQPAPGNLLPMTKMRRTIAEHMVSSKRTSPHVTTVMEADMSRVVAHRAEHKPVYARDGVNLTYTAYFIAAIAAALKFHPQVNSSWTDEGIRQHREINIGMATALEDGDGLIVPVIKNAGDLSLLGLAGKINDLAQRARSKGLQPDEVRGGTFTLTNHGISGSLFATPIINQPQCGILGVGAMEKRVVVIGDAIAIRPMVYISLTFDHRILDGASADYFLARVKNNLENWN